MDILYKLKNNKIWIIIALSFFLRFYHLSYQSLWSDEIYFWKLVAGLNSLDFLKNYTQFPDFHPPGYLLVLNLLGQIFPLNEVTMRFPSALAGGMSCYFIYKIGKDFFSEKVGMMSSLLWVSSGASLYYSQEARPYSVLVFVSLLHIIMCQKNLSVQNNNKWKAWACLVLSSLACFYTHYIGLCFALFCSSLFFLLSCKKTSIKKSLHYVCISFFSLIIFFPWLLMMMKHSSLWTITKSYNQNPNLIVYLARMLKFSFSYESYWVVDASLIGPGKIYTFAMILLSLIFILGLRNIKDLKINFHFFVVLILLSFIPILVTFGKDSLSESRFFYERNFIFIVPLLYIVISQWLVATIKPVLHNFLFFSLLSIVAFQPMINQNFHNSIYKTEFRQLSEEVKKHQSTSIYLACGTPFLFEYYLGEKILKIEEFNLRAPEKDYWIIGQGCLYGNKISADTKGNLLFWSPTGVWAFKGP